MQIGRIAKSRENKVLQKKLVCKAPFATFRVFPTPNPEPPLDFPLMCSRNYDDIQEKGLRVSPGIVGLHGAMFCQLVYLILT